VLKWLELKAIELNCFEIALHAFAHNKNAIRLYQSLEYNPTNIHMSKNLKSKDTQKDKSTDFQKQLKNLEELNLFHCHPV